METRPVVGNEQIWLTDRSDPQQPRILRYHVYETGPETVAALPPITMPRNGAVTVTAPATAEHLEEAGEPAQ